MGKKYGYCNHVNGTFIMISFFKKSINNIKYILFSQKNNIGIDAPLKLEFKNKYYYIDNNQFSIFDINTIYYGVASLSDKYITYYVRLSFKTEVNDIVLNQGFELINIDNFIRTMDEFNIPVLPTIVKNGIYVVKGFALTIEYECSVQEKYLVSIYDSTLSQNNFSINDICIEELLEKPKKYMSSTVSDNKKFNIKILSKKITFSRGYGIYPVLNNEIIIEDIFYSFNEDEIKIKIIELSDKYNR